VVTINFSFISPPSSRLSIAYPLCILASRDGNILTLFCRWCIGPDGKETLYPLSTTVSATPTHIDSATHTDEHGHTVETGYTNCHSRDGQTYCTNAHGEEVLVSSPDLANGTDEPPVTDEKTLTTQCVVSQRDFNKKLRIGTIFIVLVTSSIGKAPLLYYLCILE